MYSIPLFPTSNTIFIYALKQPRHTLPQKYIYTPIATVGLGDEDSLSLRFNVLHSGLP